MPASSAPTIAEQLARAELFRGLELRALEEVATLGRLQVLPRGAIVFTQGVPADRAHVLIEGRIRIAQSGAEGGKLIVRFVGPGETFGTVALFTDHRYPAEASTVLDSVVMSWAEPTFLEILQRHPAIASNLVTVIGSRLREVQERLRELATQPAEQRVAHALLRLAGLRAVRSGSDDAAIEFPLTRQDIAQLCGTTLYTVSRILTAWEKAGYVATHRKRVSIQRLSEIRSLAGRRAMAD